MLWCSEADSGNKENGRSHGDRDADVEDVSSDIHVPGRVVLNLWRILRHEVNLFYSLCDVFLLVLLLLLCVSDCVCVCLYGCKWSSG